MSKAIDKEIPPALNIKGTKLKDDPAEATIQTAVIFGTVGLIWGQIQNMYRNPPVTNTADSTTLQIIKIQQTQAQRMSHLGRVASFFALTGASYTATERIMRSMRGKDDYVNKAAGGCTIGLLMGSVTRRPKHMISMCLSMSTLFGAAEMYLEQEKSLVLSTPERFNIKVKGLSTPEDMKE
eukprot:CAMPEP_0171474962 /NCGR_PEP_ID=MMETSP0946-20130122/2729_1 /TAXON_ID=109269 /ORGANISM="Vaucheria litorea, Strain CCMP2940" /LENGTH=180 /DNA_ID=CAMNT_0012004977 /DNA_START=25 /DNA_END=567 /DNA_ORIENTATION=+